MRVGGKGRGECGGNKGVQIAMRGGMGGEMRGITSLANDIIRRGGDGVSSTQVATEIFTSNDYCERFLTREREYLIHL